MKYHGRNYNKMKKMNEDNHNHDIGNNKN
jgi:hypothetical protein